MCFGWGEREGKGFAESMVSNTINATNSCVSPQVPIIWPGKTNSFFGFRFFSSFVRLSLSCSFFPPSRGSPHTWLLHTLWVCWAWRGGGDGKFSPQSCLKHSSAVHKSKRVMRCRVSSRKKTPKWKPSFQTREFPVLRSTAKTCRKAKRKSGEVGRCVQPDCVWRTFNYARKVKIDWTIRIYLYAQFLSKENNSNQTHHHSKRSTKKTIPLVLVKSDFFTIRFASVNQPT